MIFVSSSSDHFCFLGVDSVAGISDGPSVGATVLVSPNSGIAVVECPFTGAWECGVPSSFGLRRREISISQA